MSLRDASDLVAWPVLSSGTHTTQECKHTQCDTEQGSVPNVSFSPESGGNVKPSSAMEEMSTQGTMRLKK